MKIINALIGSIILSANVVAGPVDYSNVSLFVDSVAGLNAGVSIASESLDIPPANSVTDLPLVASAEQGGQSFADALIDMDQAFFILDTITEASSENGEFSDSTAVSEFTGAFSGAGTFSFRLNFESLSELVVPGIDDFAESELLAEIIVDGFSIYSDALTDTGELGHQFMLNDASSALLNVVLASSTGTATPGANAFNFSNASFNIHSIPEPGTGLLIATGLVGFSMRSTRRKHAGAAALPQGRTGD